MPADSAFAGYRTKIQDVQRRTSEAEDTNRTSLHAVVAALALVAAMFYGGMRNHIPFWSFLLPVPAVFAAGRWHGKNRDKWRRLLRLQKLYWRGVARMEDQWHGNGFTGLEFSTPHHVYEVDLQILGAGSLFEYLCTARTGIGRRRLAEYLLHPCRIAETKARQQAVRELRPKSDWRDSVGLLGEFDFQESSWEVFAEWMGVPAQTVPLWLRVAMLASALALVGIAVAGIATSIPWSLLTPWLAPLVALRMGVALNFRTRTNELNAAARRVGVDISVVREGIQFVGGLTFSSENLLAIQTRLVRGNAAKILRRLQRLTNALAECDKPYFDLPSQALNLKTQLCFEIEEWKLQYGRHLAEWLDAWAEFEALMALSCYACEHPEDVFPEFGDGGKGDAEFAAHGLGHPLIPAASCVRNDVTLGAGNRFYVVSGSNMAGKSTLLRSIGLNAALAKAGAPVRAASLRLSELEVFASLSIVDSILEGKSKFLAEVERVRKMLERAGHTRVLFLIDEILSGTNSRDRRIASEAVVRALVGHGAIGALSTHDLALTEIAELPELAGSNVHMGARAGDDPMDFDYLLKPGVTKETNALAIAAMMGVPGVIA